MVHTRRAISATPEPRQSHATASSQGKSKNSPPSRRRRSEYSSSGLRRRPGSPTSDDVLNVSAPGTFREPSATQPNVFPQTSRPRSRLVKLRDKVLSPTPISIVPPCRDLVVYQQSINSSKSQADSPSILSRNNENLGSVFVSFEPSAKYHATDKDNFTSDAEFNDLMNLKNVQSTGPVSKLKSSKKSTMVFPVCSYPPRTRSMIKDTVPKSSIPKGKRKIQDFVDDPDYEIEEPSSPTELVGASRSTKKQKNATSSKPTESATKPQKHSTRPLTRGVTDKCPDSTAAKSSKETSATVRDREKICLSYSEERDQNICIFGEKRTGGFKLIVML